MVRGMIVWHPPDRSDQGLDIQSLPDKSADSRPILEHFGGAVLIHTISGCL